MLAVKYNTGYSFISHKVPQDFRAIYVKEFSFKSRCYCPCSGFEKEKQRIDLYKGRGARAQVPKDMILEFGPIMGNQGFPGGLDGKKSACSAGDQG